MASLQDPSRYAMVGIELPSDESFLLEVLAWIRSLYGAGSYFVWRRFLGADERQLCEILINGRQYVPYNAIRPSMKSNAVMSSYFSLMRAQEGEIWETFFRRVDKAQSPGTEFGEWSSFGSEDVLEDISSDQ